LAYENESTLSDVISEKLTKIEEFLLRGKVNINDWVKPNKENEGQQNFPESTYLDLSHEISISKERFDFIDKGYKEIRIDSHLLKKVLTLYQRNNGNSFVLRIGMKEGFPLRLFDEKKEVYTYIAPCVEDDD